MSIIKFAKLSGAGNDFVIIDNRLSTLAGSPSRLAVKVCALKTGVGADGLILVEKSRRADFRMRIFNPDGSEAEMCGNGARCAARYAYLRKIAGAAMTFETKAGLISALVKGREVSVRMSDPHGFRSAQTVRLDGKERELFFVNTGVPHAVMFVTNIGNIPVGSWGRTIREHRLFKPGGANADFVARIDKHNIAIRTYERGVEDETLACGTGSVAAALISAGEKGLVSPVRVHTRGGAVLKISFRHNGGQFTDVFLEGAVRFVFAGNLEEI
jgi:diaminopimelate epimerase